jgi:MFS family permease
LAPYRRLLAAYTLNELAWSFSSLTLSYLIYRRTGSALGAAAFFLGTLFAPALVAPMIVARIDRTHPRTILPKLYGLEALAFFLLALIANHASWIVVLAIATLDGVIALSARSIARAATVAVTAPAGLLREGNALTNTMFTVCFTAGPLVAGLVVATGGTAVVLLGIGALFAVITFVLVTADGLPAAEPSEHTTGRRRLRAAMGYVREHRLLRVLFGLQSALLLFFTISVPVEIVYAEHTLHVGAAGYGVLLSAWGGGAVAGSTIYARWRRLPSRELIVLGTVLLGAGLVVMAMAPTLAVAFVGSAVAGVGNGIYAVAARTAVQEAVEPAWMPLVMSFNESLGQAVPGAGILVGGLVAELFGPRPALAAGGVGALVLTVAAWIVLRPTVRLTRPHIEGPAHDQA